MGLLVSANEPSWRTFDHRLTTAFDEKEQRSRHGRRLLCFAQRSTHPAQRARVFGDQAKPRSSSNAEYQVAAASVGSCCASVSRHVSTWSGTSLPMLRCSTRRRPPRPQTPCALRCGNQGPPPVGRRAELVRLGGVKGIRRKPFRQEVVHMHRLTPSLAAGRRSGGARPRLATAALAAGLLTGGLALSAQAADAAQPVQVKIKHHVLVVKGTAASDRIALRQSATEIGRSSRSTSAITAPPTSGSRATGSAASASTPDAATTARIDEANGAFTTTTPTYLNGQRGNDTLIGGSADTLNGGDGNDTLVRRRRTPRPSTAAPAADFVDGRQRCRRDLVGRRQRPASSGTRATAATSSRARRATTP